MTTEMTVTVKVPKIGSRYLALAQLGGITVKSPPCESEEDAVRQLFATMANDGRDAALGISLALGGTTLQDEIGGPAELDAG